MECLFIPELRKGDSRFEIEDEEFRHIKALHVREGEKLLASNGGGVLFELIVDTLEKRKARVSILSEIENVLPEKRLGLALGILDNKDRFEFALEKAIELGVSDFYPLLCRFSQKSKVNLDRLEAKAIAALKQSKRAFMPTIHKPIEIKEILAIPNVAFLFADMDSKEKMKFESKNGIIIAGPEGGFNEEELNTLRSDQNVVPFTLGDFRLRAETAAIASLSIANYFF
jgi:16S rRNA (uracil1498-N3)-methyltransferase